MIKNIKTYINSILNETEECTVTAELFEGMDKSKGKVYLSIITHKPSPQEKAILLIEKSSDVTGYQVNGFYTLKQDFGLKIVGEMNFNIFFKETKQILSFESQSVSTMWTIISALTKACQFSPNIKLEHYWTDNYINTFKLTPNETTNRSIKKQQNQGKNSNSKTKSNSIENLDGSLDFNAMKESFIKNKLKEREDEFTEYKKLIVVIGTWNVNQKIPKKNLKTWLHMDEYQADIYACGLQEIDMSASALLKEETEAGDAWDSIFENTFDSSKYEKIHSKQLVGLYNCVYVKKSLLQFLEDPKLDESGVGALGMMGNKGGIGIRFKLFESTLCFFTAHLAAKQSKVTQRNQNFHDIINNTTFGQYLEYHPYNHDFLFFYGDLNYRLNLKYEEALELIKKKDYETLLKPDQLTKEQKEGRTLENFIESKITFPPTYKFDVGTDIYDTGEKKRIPAYCDRILYRTQETKNINNLIYTSHGDYMVSDHKPVVSIYEVSVKELVQKNYNAIYSEILKETDKMENALQMEVSVEKNDFNFKDVKYGQPITQTLSIKNTGNVIAQFAFAPKGESKLISKKWLKINPTHGLISPSKTAEIQLTIDITKETSFLFNVGLEKLDDVVIFHLKTGGDNFISVQGNFIKSAFGNSLENLVLYPKGSIRNDENKRPDDALKIPKELWILVDYIYRNGINEEELFKEQGDSDEVDKIMELLDQGEFLNDGEFSIHSITETLIKFLGSQVESVVPSKYYDKCIEGCASKSQASALISKLPPIHYNCFQYIVAFLKELLDNNKKLDLDEISFLFSSVLVRAPIEDLKNVYEKKAVMNFIKLFLDQDSKFF